MRIDELVQLLQQLPANGSIEINVASITDQLSRDNLASLTNAISRANRLSHLTLSNSEEVLVTGAETSRQVVEGNPARAQTLINAIISALPTSVNALTFKMGTLDIAMLDAAMLATTHPNSKLRTLVLEGCDLPSGALSNSTRAKLREAKANLILQMQRCNWTNDFNLFGLSGDELVHLNVSEMTLSRDNDESFFSKFNPTLALDLVINNCELGPVAMPKHHIGAKKLTLRGMRLPTERLNALLAALQTHHFLRELVICDVELTDLSSQHLLELVLRLDVTDLSASHVSENVVSTLVIQVAASGKSNVIKLKYCEGVKQNTATILAALKDNPRLQFVINDPDNKCPAHVKRQITAANSRNQFNCLLTEFQNLLDDSSLVLPRHKKEMLQLLKDAERLLTEAVFPTTQNADQIQRTRALNRWLSCALKWRTQLFIATNGVEIKTLLMDVRTIFSRIEYQHNVANEPEHALVNAEEFVKDCLNIAELFLSYLEFNNVLIDDKANASNANNANDDDDDDAEAADTIDVLSKKTINTIARSYAAVARRYLFESPNAKVSEAIRTQLETLCTELETTAEKPTNDADDPATQFVVPLFIRAGTSGLTQRLKMPSDKQIFISAVFSQERLSIKTDRFLLSSLIDELNGKRTLGVLVLKRNLAKFPELKKLIVDSSANPQGEPDTIINDYFNSLNQNNADAVDEFDETSENFWNAKAQQYEKQFANNYKKFTNPHADLRSNVEAVIDNLLNPDGWSRGMRFFYGRIDTDIAEAMLERLSDKNSDVRNVILEALTIHSNRHGGLRANSFAQRLIYCLHLANQEANPAPISAPPVGSINEMGNVASKS